METLIEFWQFLLVRKKYWLMPIFLVMAIFGGMVVLSEGSVISPIIYAMF